MKHKTCLIKIIRTFLAVLLAAPLVSPVYSLDEEAIVTEYLWQKVTAAVPPHRPRVALVLGGGGARGLAHIGVLKVLEEEKVPVDMIVGTSVGALIGALYASGAPMDRIEQMGEIIRWSDLTNISDSNLVKLLISEHLLSTEKIEQYLETNIGHKRFDELKIPFACVATDLLTGERVIFREGEVAPAARASSTIPGVFDPVEYRHRYLVDGGLYDNVPTDVAKLLGADVIITVAVTSDFSRNNVSNVFMVLTQSIYIQGHMWDEERLKISDIVIRPKVSDVSAVDLGRSRECIDAGILAARQAMPQLKAMLTEKISDERLFR